ncbi:MAG TPA: protein kinase [Woeseiaceae bacterium]|nr:protein kinase [Woeseiaceae bacterium]
MSANLDSIEQSFSDQLSKFDAKIKTQEDNASLLNEIHASLTVLIARSGDHDEEIREILQKRYNAGKLRLETYQLVRNVLDRVVIESMVTMPDAVDDVDTDSSYRETTVIEGGAGEQEPRQEHLQIGSLLRDRFLLQERVSGGSMGVVYKAHDRRLAEADGFDPWVAIKVLSPKLSRNAHALRALQQEAAKGRCLSHPNIVRFVDLDRDGDIYFIVMEWLEGRSLAAILDENKNTRIDLETSLDIVRQVGLALDYAHRCGVVHADVKPANIMLTSSGQVKLFDFGIARIRQKQQDGRSSFDPGVLGAITPAYSSMQVLTGEDPAPTDDVFSLGCLMYRLVAGHRVFGPRNAAEAAEQGMEPQRPQGLSDSQWRALKKSLAFSRVARFATPADFLLALESDESSRHTGSRGYEREFGGAIENPIRVDPKPRPPEGRHYWPTAIIFLAVVAVALALVAQPQLLDRARDLVTAGDASDGASDVVDIAGPEDATGSGSLPDDAAVEDPADPADEAGVPSGDAGGVATPDEDPAVSQEQRPGDPAVTRAPRQQDPAAEDPFVEAPMETDDEAAPTAGRPEEQVVRQPAPSEPQTQQQGAGTAEPAPAAAAATAATAIVPLASPGSFRTEADLTLLEGEDELAIDLVRQVDLGTPLSVRLEEVGFSGASSPLQEGRYRLSNNGIAVFDAGQGRARINISMPSDDVRNPDVQAALLVRDIENPGSELALINLVLEDDDQRSFESTLPQDTVGFATGRMYVNERDAAIQVDVLRYNPGPNELELRYFVAGGSATEGEDYFLPGSTGLVFEPGQRSARLLIPLVQDSVLEADETFILELRTDSGPVPANIFRRIEVIIRDDDG